MGRVAEAPDTESLIARVAAGERVALAALVARDGARINGLCRRHGGKGADALFGRIWVAVWQAAPGFAASGLTGDDWLTLLAREVIVAELRAARAAQAQDDVARLADLPPLLPRAGVLAPCLAALPDDAAEAVTRAIETGETEAGLALRFGMPPEAMAHMLDGALSALDRCLGGEGGSAAARLVLGLATDQAARAFTEAASDDPLLRAGRARWAHAVAGAFTAPPAAPAPGAVARINRRLFDEEGGGILRRVGLIPSLVAALIGALILVWLGGGTDPLGEPLAPSEAPAD
ncbi:MAG: hypothetical protein H3C51_07735 [Rubellimicrobium sp.]|nr:hypothetical protein [Rubellimicrobium sp.]